MWRTHRWSFRVCLYKLKDEKWSWEVFLWKSNSFGLAHGAAHGSTLLLEFDHSPIRDTHNEWTTMHGWILSSYLKWLEKSLNTRFRICSQNKLRGHNRDFKTVPLSRRTKAMQIFGPTIFFSFFLTWVDWEWINPLPLSDTVRKQKHLF